MPTPATAGGARVTVSRAMTPASKIPGGRRRTDNSAMNPCTPVRRHCPAGVNRGRPGAGSSLASLAARQLGTLPDRSVLCCAPRSNRVPGRRRVRPLTHERATDQRLCALKRLSASASYRSRTLVGMRPVDISKAILCRFPRRRDRATGIAAPPTPGFANKKPGRGRWRRRTWAIT